MQDLKITIVQKDLSWKDRDKNLSGFEQILKGLLGTDVLLLPEMFSTGFVVDCKGIAEDDNGTTVQWMKKMAKEKNCAVAGSVAIEDGGKYFNRFYWVLPGGDFMKYDKRHLFGFAGESEHFSEGHTNTLIEYKGWKFLPQICYDLRFPVWSRNKFENGEYDYDCLIYVANWPDVRSDAWRSLLQARAIENMSFCVGVNRVGYDGNQIKHRGDSMVFSPTGELISNTMAYKESVETVLLSAEHIMTFRKKFPFAANWDKFTVTD